MKTYFFNLLIALDQLAKTLAGGDPDETISSRAGKYAARRSGWFPCQLCKILNWLDPNHCEKNIQPEEGSDGLIWSNDK